jgi:hypothetical protein
MAAMSGNKEGNDVPESTRRYARENKEMLEHILLHGSSIDTRAYAGALLVRGLPNPELERVFEELRTERNERK